MNNIQQSLIKTSTSSFTKSYESTISVLSVSQSSASSTNIKTTINESQKEIKSATTSSTSMITQSLTALSLSSPVEVKSAISTYNTDIIGLNSSYNTSLTSSLMGSLNSVSSIESKMNNTYDTSIGNLTNGSFDISSKLKMGNVVGLSTSSASLFGSSSKTLTDGLSGSLSSMSSLGSSMDSVQNISSNLIENIGSKTDGLMDSLSSLPNKPAGLMDSISSITSSNIASMTSSVNDITNNLTSSASGYMDTIENGISDSVNFMSNISSNVEDIFDSLETDFTLAGIEDKATVIVDTQLANIESIYTGGVDKLSALNISPDMLGDDQSIINNFEDKIDSMLDSLQLPEIPEIPKSITRPTEFFERAVGQSSTSKYIQVNNLTSKGLPKKADVLGATPDMKIMMPSLKSDTNIAKVMSLAGGLSKSDFISKITGLVK